MKALNCPWQPKIQTALMVTATSNRLKYSQWLQMFLIFYLSVSLSSLPSSREKEQRCFSPHHKDSRDNNLCVYGSGATAPHHLHPGASQTTTKEGNMNRLYKDGRPASTFSYCTKVKPKYPGYGRCHLMPLTSFGARVCTVEIAAYTPV